MNGNIYCKIYLDSDKLDDFFEGIFYMENELFVVEFKSTKANITEKILHNKIIFTKSQEECQMDEPERNFTYYDFSEIKNYHYNGYCIIKILAKQRLVNIFSKDINSEIIKGFELTTNGLSNFFYDSYINSHIKDNKVTVELDNIPFIINTERLEIKIHFWNQYSKSSDEIIISGKTTIQINYIKSVEFQEAIEDTKLLKYFLSFCSNRVYNINFENIYGINNNFNIEESIKPPENQSGLFAFSYRNFNDITDFSEAIKIIFENRDFYQRIFNQFYRTVGNEKNLNLEIFSQWISNLEYLYDVQYKKIKNYSKTLEEINKIIQESNDLNNDQKTIFIQRAKGFIDNPLKEKMIKLLKESDKIYFKIDDVLLDKNSDFLSKIINTRNYYTHNTKKEIFSPIEIDKMNCFFKICVFIIAVKNLNGTLTDYYYERVKYFFDLINYEPKK